MGNCVHSATHPLEHVQLGAFVPEIEAELEQDKAVAALGFGLPGTQRLSRLVTSDYAGLLGTEFAAYYRQRFSMPVVLENDVNAAALGYCSLRGKPDATVCYLYFPRHYGPGAGIVLAGRRFCGARGLAGEIGRLLPGTDWRDVYKRQPLRHSKIRTEGKDVRRVSPPGAAPCEPAGARV